MSFFDTGGVEEEIHITADEAELRRTAEQIARVLRTALAQAFRGIEKEISQILGQSLRSAGAKQFTEDLNDIGRAGRNAQAEITDLSQDLVALAQRSKAFRESLDARGQDPRLFAVFDTQVRRLLELEKEFQERRVELAANPELLETMRAESRNIIRLLQAEQVSVGRVVDAGRSARVASMQQETTLRNAEIRTQGALAVAQEQRNARARIEIFRFATRQILFFERAIRDAFRGSVRILGNMLSGVASGISRTANLFRRSNRDINEGLNGALIQREISMDRSFSRQTNVLRTEVTRQTRILERFQAQASTGVAGIATGRSGLGALLGGGIAIGGGFVLLQKLKQGFEESVSLNESLNKTRQIFGQASDSIIEFANNSVEALFSTRSQALEAASNFGIFGRAAGLSGQELSDFSTKLTLLATDLASFNNTSVQDAVTAISAALRGESEPIRKYGVLLNEATLQARALALGIIDTKRTLQPFERVLAANAEILAQTAVAQGDAARTANDFANSSRRAAAASVETFAAIAGAAVPFATFITNLTFVTLPKLTAFIKGEVNPALLVLRDGLIGAGIALAGLLAARAAGEALQFLALSLRLVVTPLGLFIASAAALGAAINILAKRSPSMRAAINQIRDAFGSAFNLVIDTAVTLLGQLADVMTNFLLPVMETFARFLVNNLQKAIRTAFDFITDTAIPAIQQFAGFVRNDLIPPLFDLGTVLVERVLAGLVFVRDAAVNLFQVVQPFIQPALDGFTRLGGAIRDAFTGGDFSGLLGGLEAVGTGIANTFQNIGTKIINVLRPQLTKAIDFIKQFFTGKNNTASNAVENALLGPFQDAVTAVGFFLGNVITDPRLLSAIEKIIGLAILTGANFVKGFVTGVASNLDENFSLFGGQFLSALEKGIKAAFANPVTLAQIIAAGLVGQSILQAYRKAGNTGAKSLVKGFTSGISNSVRSTPEFLTGFFGGPGALEKRAGVEAEKAHAKMVQVFQAINRDLERLGQAPVTANIIDENAVRRANDALETTRERFGPIGAQAAITRGQIAETFSGMRDIVVSFSSTLRQEGLSGFQSFQQGIGKISFAFRDAFNDIAAQAGGRGAAIGSILASGIMSATGAILSGQQAGEASSGLGRGLGLAGIVGSSLLPILTTGFNPISIALSGLSLTAGLVTAAWTHNKQAAKEAAAEVDAYTDILVRFNTVAGASDDIADRITRALRDQSAQAQDVLVRAGFNVDAFTQQALSGTASIQQTVRSLATGLQIDPAVIDDFFAQMQRLGKTGPEILEDIDFKSSVSQPLRLALAEAQVDSEDFVDVIQALFGQNGAIQQAISEANFAQAINPADRIDEATASIVGQSDALDAARRQGNDYVNFLKERASAEAIAAQQTRIDTAAIEENAREAADRSRGVQQAIDELNRQHTSAIQTEINDLAARLGAAREASEQAREALLQFLQGDYGDAAKAAVNDLVLAVPNIASSLQGSFDLVPALRSATQDKALADLGTQAFNALVAAFNKGELITTDDARRVLGPFFDVVNQLASIPIEPVVNPDTGEIIQEGGGISREVADLLTGQLNKLLDDENFGILLDTISAADDTQAQLQAQMDALDIELGVKVFFDEDQIKAAFKEITGFDLDFPLASGLTGQGVIPSTVPGQQAGVIVTSNPQGGFTQPVHTSAAAGGIVIENVNINGAQPTAATAGELARRLRVASGAGFLTAPSLLNVGGPS